MHMMGFVSISLSSCSWAETTPEYKLELSEVYYVLFMRGGGWGV